MRKPIMAGNWKMHKTAGEAAGLARELAAGLADLTGVEVVLCPPFTALAAVQGSLRDTALALGAQDVFWEQAGAFTGEISVPMLADLGCSYCIVGHSERRQHFGESDADVARKAQALLEADLRPIVCVGEDVSQRQAGETDAVVTGQLRAALGAVAPERLPEVVIAYEPVWAIGTGMHASAAEAGRVAGLIRGTLAEMAGQAAAGRVRIQYGGSVKPGNIGEYVQEPEIDGALVGGASLEAASFMEIARSPLTGEELGDDYH